MLNVNDAVLVVSGRLGSGKTALQKEVTRLIEGSSRVKHFDGVVEINFADPIYEIQNDTLAKMTKWGIKHNIKKSRKFLQYIGTQFGREEFHKDIWVEIAENKMKSHKIVSGPQKKTLFIIGDCRFRNEFDKMQNALRVRLVCPEKERMERAASPSKTRHQSEIDLDLYSELGLFDMYLDTSSKGQRVENCATLVMAQLAKKSWTRKRKLLSDLTKFDIFKATVKLWFKDKLGLI